MIGLQHLINSYNQALQQNFPPVVSQAVGNCARGLRSYLPSNEAPQPSQRGFRNNQRLSQRQARPSLGSHIYSTGSSIGNSVCSSVSSFRRRIYSAGSSIAGRVCSAGSSIASRNQPAFSISEILRRLENDQRPIARPLQMIVIPLIRCVSGSATE